MVCVSKPLYTVCLPLSLLWAVRGPQKLRLTTYRVPSRSWAAVDGVVESLLWIDVIINVLVDHPYLSLAESTLPMSFEIIEASATPKFSAHTFGEVIDGFANVQDRYKKSNSTSCSTCGGSKISI